MLSDSLYSRMDEVSKKITDLKQQLRNKDKMSKFGLNVSSKTKWKNLNDFLGRNRSTKEIPKIVPEPFEFHL